MVVSYIINRDILNCNLYTLNNNSNTDDLTFDLSKFNSTTEVWDSISSTVVANDNTEELTILIDGVYKLEISDGIKDSVVHYFVVDCTVQTCKINYLDVILSCTETNCAEDCLGNNQLYYNFSVIVELSELYKILCSDFVVEPYYMATHILNSAQIKRFADIDKILARFEDYCADCIEPCKQCN